MPKTQAKEPTPGIPSFLTGIPKRLILLISKELYLDLISLGRLLFSSPNYARVITPSSLLVCLENSSCLMLLLASPLEEVMPFLTKEVGAKTV